MKALLYKKGGRANASICQVPDPVVTENQVLVRVMACGICTPADSGHDKGTSMLGEYPVVPGHEFAGIVEAVGSEVTHFKPGDRVAVDNGAPCGTCYFCQRAAFPFCENYKALGQSIDGGFAELVVSPETHVYRVPENVSMKAAALSELTGCAFHCIERCDIPYSGDVLIIGSGASGMLLAMLAKSSEAGTVTVIDSNQGKLDKIAAKGVNTVLVDREDDANHEKILMEQYPHGFDVIIDAAGDPALSERTFELLKPQGKFANYSFSNTEKKDITLNISLIARKELNYIGTTFQHHDFEKVLRAMSMGKVEPELIISRTYPLEDYFEALDENYRNEDLIKIIIEPNGCSDGK